MQRYNKKCTYARNAKKIYHLLIPCLSYLGGNGVVSVLQGYCKGIA